MKIKFESHFNLCENVLKNETKHIRRQTNCQKWPKQIVISFGNSDWNRGISDKDDWIEHPNMHLNIKSDLSTVTARRSNHYEE